MKTSNPFLSDTFTAIWKTRFAPDRPTYKLGALPSLQFVRHHKLPVYTNVGETHTKGIGYQLGPTAATATGKTADTNEPATVMEAAATRDFGNKVFLVYDVPEYFEIPLETVGTAKAKGPGLHRSVQYPGFLIDLESFESLDEYLRQQFKKSSRYKLKKYRKRFEASFDVRYVMYRGEMERATYDSIFSRFYELLEKRFDDKQITNNNLDPKEWRFYHEVAYPMILEEKAALFVVYNGATPIGITLNFFSEDILFDAITSFDIDYAKFHPGSITIMAMLEWCLENGIKTFDFSKGYFDYKARWATKCYDFEYHILFDRKSLRARSIAGALKRFFDLKQRLREKKVNDQWHRLTYRFRKRTPKPLSSQSYTFTEVDTGTVATTGTTTEIALDRPEEPKSTAAGL